ncbi:MAG: hypothetical protein HC890_15900 [Chloroflexaceae bacterium]|nr:hypothetical protein [Chloroflexaceae bacterium]
MHLNPQFGRSQEGSLTGFAALIIPPVPPSTKSIMKPLLLRLMAIASFSAAITVLVAEPNAADAATLRL